MEATHRIEPEILRTFTDYLALFTEHAIPADPGWIPDEDDPKVWAIEFPFGLAQIIRNRIVKLNEPMAWVWSVEVHDLNGDALAPEVQGHAATMEIARTEALAALRSEVKRQIAEWLRGGAA